MKLPPSNISPRATDHRWGATLDEWAWAEYQFGQDLLPAVGDPTFTGARSERIQHLDSLAKTPSFIGGNGVAYGISKWTAHIATPDHTRRWKSDPALNILLITRNVRAIDIDVDDAEIANKLEHYICTMLGVKLPVRYRDNSGKRTLLLKLDPHTVIKKRVIHTEWGAIEFLADGQQTALFGTHSSGERFKHRGFESGIPTVAQSLMAQAWDELRKQFDPTAKPLIINGEQIGDYTLRNGGVLKNDPLLQYLYDEGLVQTVEQSGIVHVVCPNAAQHTSDSVGSSSYFPPGLGGKDRPGFKCLHSHCQHIDTKLFSKLIGYEQKELVENFGQNLEPHPAVAVQQKMESLPAEAPLDKRQAIALAVSNGRDLASTLNLEMNAKGTAYAKTVANLVRVMSCPQIADLRFDTFKQVCHVRIGGQGQYQKLTDHVVGHVRLVIETMTGLTYSHEEVSRQLSLTADLNSYDSGVEWVEQQKWDGVQRLKFFARDILKTEESEYGEAFGEYLFAALAGRILSPGAKSDIMPVLVSPKQGTGKSSLVSQLAPFADWFGTGDFTQDDDDIYRSIRGKNVIELPELRGLMGREAAHTKALLTQDVDSWTPKYMEHSIEVPRRCLFIGTDNRNRFLTDPTGNRRFAPIKVARTAEFIDWPTYVENRNQYYAEAAAMLAESRTVAAGIEKCSTRLRKLAAPHVADATVLDPWYPTISQFIYAQRPGTEVSLMALNNHMFNSGVGALDNAKAWRFRNVMTTMKLEEVAPDVWRTPTTFVL